MTTPKNPAWPRVWVRFRRWNDEVHYEKPENANHNDFEMISLAEQEAIVSERVREARAEVWEEAATEATGYSHVLPGRFLEYAINEKNGTYDDVSDEPLQSVKQGPTRIARATKPPGPTGEGEG